MRSMAALYVANAKEFFRNSSSVLFVLLLPVAFAAFFGVIFSGGGSFTLQLGVVNEDVGPAGSSFVAGLMTPEAGSLLKARTGSRSEMMDALNRGDVGIVLTLPSNMSASVSAGRTAAVEVFYDPGKTASAAGLGVIRTLLGEANLAMSGSPRLLRMEEKSVQTHPLRAIDLYLPALLGVAFLWLGLFGTAAPLVEQRESQLLRRLRVTALRPAQILAAHVGWRATVGILQTVLFLAVGYLAFGVGVQGSVILFAAGVTLGALVFVSIGYLLAGLAKSSEGVVALGQIVNFPMMFLSGAFIPLEMMPDSLRPVAAALPLTYLNDVLRQVMVAAPAVNPLWMDFAVLSGWLVVTLALAVKFWRWE